MYCWTLVLRYRLQNKKLVSGTFYFLRRSSRGEKLDVRANERANKPTSERTNDSASYSIDYLYLPVLSLFLCHRIRICRLNYHSKKGDKDCVNYASFLFGKFLLPRWNRKSDNYIRQKIIHIAFASFRIKLVLIFLYDIKKKVAMQKDNLKILREEKIEMNSCDCEKMASIYLATLIIIINNWIFNSRYGWKKTFDFDSRVKLLSNRRNKISCAWKLSIFIRFYQNQ